MIVSSAESIRRTLLVKPNRKAKTIFSYYAKIYDRVIGWRFVNPFMKKQYDIDSTPKTGEHAV